MQITKTAAAAAIATILVAIAVLQHSTGWAQGNNAPVIATPSSTSLHYLFPRGNAAELTFSSEPASDQDGGETLTYRFVITVPDISTTNDASDTTDVSPAEALFNVTRTGNTFEFTAVEGVTPKRFNNLFGNVIQYTIPVKMYANDGTVDSESLAFTITAYHDASPQFHLAATHQGKQRWQLNRPVTVYEGVAANPSLAKIILGDYDQHGEPNPGQPDRLTTAGDVLQIPWTSSQGGTRQWSTGNRENINGPKIICNDGSGYVALTWARSGSEDGSLFTTSTPAQNRQGHATLAFTNTPDFENPADNGQNNQYRVRLVNDHNIHKLGSDTATLGCDGSAIDIVINVKNVGTPAPITPTGSYHEDDDSKITIAWTAPTGFVEHGSVVDFPHAAFAPTSYDYRYRPTGTEEWTTVTGHTSTTATIEDLPNNGYELQVRGTNPEGASNWPDSSVAITYEPSKPDQPDKPTLRRPPARA